MIPKKIHFCWLSGEPFPEIVTFCIASWKEKLPDYEFILWDLKRFDIESSKWVKEAFSAKKYAFAADYIRLHALYYEGGIYLDSDVEVLKKFDNLLCNNSFIGFETTGDLEPAIIGAKPKAFWIKKCLDYYNNRTFIKGNGMFDTKPLPMIMGDILKKELCLLENNKLPYTIQNITFYPEDYFSPRNIYTKKIKITDNTIAIHHFDGSWIEKDMKVRSKELIHLFFIRFLGKKNHKKLIHLFRKIKSFI